MATITLLPNCIVVRDGIYKVSHSSGHLKDGECFLRKGIVLPSCGKPDCLVMYTFVREGSFVPDDKPS